MKTRSSSSDPIAAGAPGGISARRFGSRATDLELDLGGQRRPEVLTGVLARCLSRGGDLLDASTVWDMPVGSRIAWLLAIADLEGDGPFTVVLRCPRSDCLEQMEIEVTLEDVLSTVPPGSAEPVAVAVDGVRFVLRRPTGSDQLRWLGAGPAAMNRRAILQSLIVEGPRELTDGHVEALEAALDEHDPLLRFTITTECLACSVTSEHETSLTDCALTVLQRAQQRVIEEVHVLGRAYGWREPDILALPPWRRSRYLGLVATQGRV